MEQEGFAKFFERASKIYDSAGGYATLVNAVVSGELKDGLSEEDYRIATFILSDYLGSRLRTFGGIPEHERPDLVRRCINTKITNNPPLRV